MRLNIVLFAVICCLCVVAQGAFLEPHEILSTAQQCCASSCSSQDTEDVRSYIAAVGTQNVHFASLLEDLLDGKCGNDDVRVSHPRAAGDFALISCPPGEFDTTNGDVIVKCNFTVVLHPEIAYLYAWIERDFGSGSGYFSYYESASPSFNVSTNATSYAASVSFRLPKYLPPGRYYVTGLANTATYATVISNSTITVKQNFVDVDPPVLTKIWAPTYDSVQDSYRMAIYVSASDVAGLKRINITVSNATHAVGTAEWVQYFYAGEPYGTPNVTNGSLYISFWYSPVRDGTYKLSISLCDILGYCSQFSYEQLVQRGIQASFVVLTKHTLTITCPTTQYDVQSQSLSVPCYLNLTSTGVYSYDVTANLYENYYSTTYYATGGSAYTYPSNNITRVAKTVYFVLPQYAPNGTYSVWASARGLPNVYLDAYSSFFVKDTINDRAPPVLRNLTIAPINLTANSTPRYAFVAATDDISLTLIEIKFERAYMQFGYASWYAPNNTKPLPPPLTAFSGNLPISLTNLPAGMYDLSVRLCDSTRRCITYYAQNLRDLQLQDTVNVGPVQPDKADVWCHAGPHDVGNSSVPLSCNYSLYLSRGIYNAYASVQYSGNPGYYSVPTDLNYYDYSANTSTLAGQFRFTIPQYSPYGNYSVEVLAYSFNYERTISKVVLIWVKQTKNDRQLPLLTGVYVKNPVYDLTNLRAIISASDDVSGLRRILVTVYNNLGGYGNGNWNVTSNLTLGQNTTIKNLTIPIQTYTYGGDANGTYQIAVELADNIGYSRWYSGSELTDLGLQSNFTVLSSGCPAGKYKPVNSSPTTACSACAKGTTSPPGAFKCTSCPGGTYWVTSVNGTSSQCVPCPAGSYGIGASWACTACAAGYFQYATGQTRCISCKAGTTSAAGSNNCTDCPAGTYTIPAKAGCTPCGRGTYLPWSDDNCYPCEPGTYTNSTGSTQCTPCAAGSYSTGNTNVCTLCPAGKTGPEGSNSSLNCYVDEL